MTKRQLEVLSTEKVSVVDRFQHADLPLSPSGMADSPVVLTRRTIVNPPLRASWLYLKFARLLVPEASRTAVSNIHYHSAFDVSKALPLSIQAGLPSGLPAFLFPRTGGH